MLLSDLIILIEHVHVLSTHVFPWDSPHSTTMRDGSALLILQMKALKLGEVKHMVTLKFIAQTRTLKCEKGCCYWLLKTTGANSDCPQEAGTCHHPT